MNTTRTGMWRRGLTRSAAVMTAALVVLAAGTAAVHAQPGPRGGRGPGGMGPGGPMPSLQVEGLRELDLSETQREQVRTIMASHREEAQAQAARHRAAMDALQEATLGNDEAAIRQQAEAVGAAIGDGAVLRAKVRTEVWAVLTPEQQATAEKLRAERKTRAAERQQRMQQRMQERARGGPRQG